MLICGAAPGETGPASTWRKPEPGMFLAARDRFALDLPNSIMIGDRDTDMRAARAAGVGRRILLAGGTGEGRDPPRAGISCARFRAITASALG